ncbi:unnamed protein product [Paramecium sonneborni]|uniref:EF-hand domain-containing protein n=1 Tax=Paramecium sonneborni TaxID=65129 RepID=A0A8S1K1J9_9CILI|nr:unnamed protein product [Paramecium sonneborni]
MQQIQQGQAEHQSIQKLQQFLQGLNKSIIKQGVQANLQTISNNLDAAANEIGFLLQSRDLNEYSHIVNKLSSVWKELYRTVSNSKLVNEFENESSDYQQKLELISQAKRQMKDGIGEIGQFGGVRVSAYQTPQTKNQMKQMSRQQTGLPSISGQTQTEYKHKTNYEIDDNQREILQEVLRQGNKLNVQIVMKRYDPKITLMLSEGTDTNLDIQEAIRGFNRDYLEIKLQEITKENLKNIEEIQKVMQEKHEFTQVNESSATDKLKSIYKTIYTKTTEMDQLMIEASKQEPQVAKDILDEFLYHVTHNYKDIQSETFKIVAKVFQQMQQKQKQDELLKSRTLQVQQPQHKKDKLSSSKRGNQSSADESQVSDKIRQELIEKKLEVDKKNQEIFELQNKVRQAETQYIQTSLELESMKLNVSRSEQEKAQLNYEFKKMEKQLTSLNSKNFQDQAIQCTDINQQNLISKLQKDNQQFQQKVYQLKNELNKISPSSGRELKQQNTEFQDKSDDQNIQNSQVGTPRQTSRYKSAQDFENQQYEDGFSIDQRLDSSQQIYKNSEVSNRERLDDMGFERSPTHSNTVKATLKNKTSTLVETRQTNSPLSNSERSVKVSLQTSQTNFNPKKKKQKSILKIEEEDSTLNQSAELQKQKIKKQAFSNKVTRRQTTLEVASKDFFKNQNSIKEQDESQAATNFETQRTQSGQAINKPKRIKSVDKKNNVNGRRIQTEGQEQFQESEDSESENGNSKVKFSRSTTQRDQKKLTIKKVQQQTSSKNVQVKKSIDIQMIATVEEIPSNITSQQSLDKFSLKQQNTIEETDQQLRHKKDQLKFNGSSPIKRSSTSVPQQLQMIIKLNDEDQQQFTTYWHQRHIDQETQTENQLLMQLIQSTISQLDLPMNIKQNMIQQLPKKLETAVAIALNQSQIIHQTGNLSSEYLQQLEITSPHSSRLSQESFRQKQIKNQRSLDSQGKQKLQSLLDLNQFEPPLTKTSLDSKIGQLTQKNSIEIADQANSEKSEIFLKSKGELEKQFLQQQEQVLRMEEFMKSEDEDLGYEELAKQIIANENAGQPLEQFKQNDLQSENFMKRLHNSMTNQKTKGATAIQDMLKRFYKKNPKDQITFQEFKGFYQKVFATHKQCGFNIVCSHLQRFIMKLGFTCTLFSKRKLLKTSLSILKPFNPLHETKQKLVNQSATNQNSSKFQTNQHFSVDQ